MLEPEERGGAARHPYHGSQPSVVSRVFEVLPDRHDYSLVDLGCGKGRVLLIAAQFGFRHVLGVEIKASLARISRRNVARVRRRRPNLAPITVDVGDAFRYDLPSGLSDRVVYFLYNPFGPEAIESFVEHLERTLAGAGRHLFVVYYNPLYADLMDASPHLERYWAEQVPHAPEEHGFAPPLTSEAVVVWQSIPLRYQATDSAGRPIHKVPGQFHVTVGD
jgi:SAM-dependent methyltransferase